MISNDTEYAITQIERRQIIPLSADKNVYFISPEDLILNKLRSGKDSRSEKQWRDVLSIMKTQRENLDDSYLIYWSAKLEIIDEYQ